MLSERSIVAKVNITPIGNSKSCKVSFMNLQELFRDFFQKAAETLEEYHVQCQSMAFETDLIQDYVDRPTFRFRPGVARPYSQVSDGMMREAVASVQRKDVIYTAEMIAEKDSDWLDDKFVQCAAKTKKPLGQCFMKKMRHLFPSLTRPEILTRIKSLIEKGRIIAEEEKRPEPQRPVPAPVPTPAPAPAPPVPTDPLPPEFPLDDIPI